MRDKSDASESGGGGPESPSYNPFQHPTPDENLVPITLTEEGQWTRDVASSTDHRVDESVAGSSSAPPIQDNTEAWEKIGSDYKEHYDDPSVIANFSTSVAVKKEDLNQPSCSGSSSAELEQRVREVEHTHLVSAEDTVPILTSFSTVRQDELAMDSVHGDFNMIASERASKSSLPCFSSSSTIVSQQPPQDPVVPPPNEKPEPMALKGLQSKRTRIEISVHDKSMIEQLRVVLSKYSESIHTSESGLYLWFGSESKEADVTTIEHTVQEMGAGNVQVCPSQAFIDTGQTAVKLMLYVPSKDRHKRDIKEKAFELRVQKVVGFIKGAVTVPDVNVTREELRSHARSSQQMDEIMCVVSVTAPASQIKAALGEIVDQTRQWCREWNQTNIGLVVDGEVFVIEPAKKKTICDTLMHNARYYLTCMCLPTCCVSESTMATSTC